MKAVIVIEEGSFGDRKQAIYRRVCATIWQRCFTPSPVPKLHEHPHAVSPLVDQYLASQSVSPPRQSLHIKERNKIVISLSGFYVASTSAASRTEVGPAVDSIITIAFI